MLTLRTHTTQRKQEAGFTLIELLVVMLIVGALAAVAAPVYFSYTKEAKLTEGKALAGSILTALQTQAELNSPAAVASTAQTVLNRVGFIGPSITTQDGKWTVTANAGMSIAADGTIAYTAGSGPALVTVTSADGVVEIQATATKILGTFCGNAGALNPC